MFIAQNAPVQYMFMIQQLMLFEPINLEPSVKYSC